MNVGRDDQAGFRLDTMATHKLHATLCVKGSEHHRKLFKIPSWELNGKFSHYWEKPGTRNSFFGIMLGSRCLPAS